VTVVQEGDPQFRPNSLFATMLHLLDQVRNKDVQKLRA